MQMEEGPYLKLDQPFTWIWVIWCTQDEAEKSEGHLELLRLENNELGQCLDGMRVNFDYI